MLDIVSINRQYLIMAREAARSPSGECITGLPRSVLGIIARLTVDQIEEIAKESGVCLITLRLSGKELERLVSLRGVRRTAYSLAVGSSGDRSDGRPG